MRDRLMGDVPGKTCRMLSIGLREIAITSELHSDPVRHKFSGIKNAGTIPGISMDERSRS
jgi:hypothetical protein